MAGIKISELSIGDWVKVDDGLPNIIEKAYKINAIAASGFVNADRNLGLLYKYDINKLSPIPLTPEILEKNGFRLVVVNKKFNDWHDNNITIRKYYNDDNYHLFVCGQKIEFKMIFVHQLQHALRLAGVEKEIEL